MIPSWSCKDAIDDLRVGAEGFPAEGRSKLIVGGIFRTGANDLDRAGSAGFQPARGDEVPLKTRSVHAWAAPTSRLEAGAPSAFRGHGRPVAPFSGQVGVYTLVDTALLSS